MSNSPNIRVDLALLETLLGAAAKGNYPALRKVEKQLQDLRKKLLMALAEPAACTQAPGNLTFLSDPAALAEAVRACIDHMLSLLEENVARYAELKSTKQLSEREEDF